ncbi:MAG TPA: hypothetical protein VMK82_06760, partial [Steroidobacteraceae bacterium]|nr:hypothetical protein [Steroidobacteraceae bacterium]
WVYPKRLVMGEGARIGHLTVVKGLDLLSMGQQASIGRLNWITGYPSGQPPHFMHQPSRRPELDMAAHSGITNRHLVDCTDQISIGSFSIVAGFRSQLLTHSINIATNRQEARPIAIGRYCFVGTASTLLGGASLPDYSVLGANSLLNKSFGESYRLYGGVPAVELGELDPQLAYFLRDNVVVI